MMFLGDDCPRPSANGSGIANRVVPAGELAAVVRRVGEPPGGRAARGRWR